MRLLNIALLSSALLLAGTALPALAGTAGVTAAVNPEARGTPPGGAVRTIVLGDNILTDEKIDTGPGGLVQVLLADGTTFTVGPNSSLTIDKFVYDPNANTAQVTASLARGVFRFIGGRTSKTEGGVEINTPVGTVGIRGAVVDMNFTPGGSIEGQIDLLFGKEVTLKSNGGSPQKIYSAGYSIVVGAGNKISIVKTPPGSTNGIQQALAGKPGTHGGTGNPPTDDAVGQSGVPGSNSNQPPLPDIGTPDPRAIQLATIVFDNSHDDAAQLIDEQGNPPHTVHGFGAVMFNGYVTSNDNVEFSGYGGSGLSELLDDTSFSLDSNSNILGGTITVAAPNYHEAGTATFAFGNAPGAPSVSFDSQHEETWHDEASAVTIGASVDVGHDCVACEFMKWGSWETNFELSGTGQNGPYVEHLHGLGTWVVGDVASNQQFDDYAETLDGVTATYQGTALGTVYNDEQSPYLASGNLEMTYDFGDHSGTLDIRHFDAGDDFDGYDFTGMQVAGALSGPAFAGSNGNDGGNSYNVNGAFTHNAGDLVAGVMGNFAVTADDGYYRATGIFVGANTTTPH